MRLTQPEFAERLGSDIGVPVSRDQVSKWEGGAGEEPSQYRWSMVPAWVVGGAARISGQALADLLGVSDDGLAARVEELERSVQVLEELVARLLAAQQGAPASKETGDKE